MPLSKPSLKLIGRKSKPKTPEPSEQPPVVFKQSADSQKNIEPAPVVDTKKRDFLRVLVGASTLLFVSTIFPKKADALVMGSTPASSVVGVKNASNTKINPATDESVQELLTGNSVLKKTIDLTASGTVHTPASGKKIRLYSSKFSLSASMTSVSFRFTAGGTDFEKYMSPKQGGLYGSRNHPNYIEGGTDEILYCSINGTGTVQINIDYLEV